MLHHRTGRKWQAKREEGKGEAGGHQRELTQHSQAGSPAPGAPPGTPATARLSETLPLCHRSRYRTLSPVIRKKGGRAGGDGA